MILEFETADKLELMYSFFSNNNFLGSLSAAQMRLRQAPQTVDLQYQVVLALARTGALDFAQREYIRYGLNNHPHERTIALRGRLLKDLASESLGNDRRQLALKSAEAYIDAYSIDMGLYPAVNVATMLLMADEGQEEIETWCQKAEKAILASTPKSPQAAYFLAASRAEVSILRGEFHKSKEYLSKAIKNDRLNYIAHATTLKQIRAILNKIGERSDWLDDFTPPKTVHFAGHLFGDIHNTDKLNLDRYNSQKEIISESIQSNDIGFGFGALAAGMDILIAETLLDEGGMLHVVLPGNVEQFLEHSVQPFGTGWIERFHACLESASSVTICDRVKPFSASSINLATDIAMGLAAFHAEWLSTTPYQLLSWAGTIDDTTGTTAKASKSWQRNGHPQINLPFELDRNFASPRLPQAKTFSSDQSAYKLIVAVNSRSKEIPSAGQNNFGQTTDLKAILDEFFVEASLIEMSTQELHFVCAANSHSVKSFSQFLQRICDPDSLHNISIGCDIFGSSSMSPSNFKIASTLAHNAPPRTALASLELASYLKQNHGSLRMNYVGEVSSSSLHLPSVKSFIIRPSFSKPASQIL